MQSKAKIEKELSIQKMLMNDAGMTKKMRAKAAIEANLLEWILREPDECEATLDAQDQAARAFKYGIKDGA